MEKNKFLLIVYYILILNFFLIGCAKDNYINQDELELKIKEISKNYKEKTITL